MKLCKHQPAPTEHHKQIAQEVHDNGGTITAEELAHSAAFDRAAMAWSRTRAVAWIKREQAEGRWMNAHAHGDGSIWVER